MSAANLKSRAKAGYSSDYSTFIEQLQTAADKLMSEVFELSSTAPMPSPIRSSQHKIITEPSFDNYKQYSKQFLRKSNASERSAKKLTSVEDSKTFRSFMARSEYFSKEKDKKLEEMHRSKEQLIERQHTFKPKINRSSERLDIKPIKDRCLQLQQSKEKKLFEQRADKKMRQENEINKIPFKPKINTKTKAKTFQDYYDEKLRWQKKRLEEREKMKQISDVKKHTECVFKPSLETQKSAFYKKNERLNENTKVQNRLLQRLDMSVEKKMKM